MKTTSLWKKVLAVPAIIALSTAGALLGAGAAQAAPAGLTVTSPTPNQTVDSRNVTVTGSVFGGSIVIVKTTTGGELARTNVGGTFGQPINYSVTLPAYAADAPVAQTIVVGGLFGGSGIPDQTVSFRLPAPAQVFSVTSPTNGSTVGSRTVTFSGTGNDGSTVNVLDTAGNRVPGTGSTAVVNGRWSTTGTYAADAPVAQTVNINQVTGGGGNGSASVSFTLPAPVEVFSVTSPTNGSTVGSRTVTFSGTGNSGSTVNVLDSAGNRVPGTGSTAVVNGRWSTTGTYAANAPVAQTVNINQVSGGAGTGNATVSFTLPAPVYTFTVTSPTAGSTVDSRTVTFSGTGTPGSRVNVLDQAGNRVPGTGSTQVFNDGNWSTTGLYADDAPVAQTVNINQLTGFSGNGEISVSFNLPAPVEVFSFTNPVVGSTVDSRTVTFSGTGVTGSFVNVLDHEGNRIPGTSSAIVSNGRWSTTGTFAADAPVAQTVTAFQTTGFSGNGEISVSFTLPAPVEAFSVTTPTQGSTVDSRTVTFSGTGRSGSTVNVLDADGNRIPGTTAAVVVNGRWSTTGTYAADAPVAQTVYVNQVSGGSGTGNVTVSFSLPAAAVVPVIPVTPTQPGITPLNPLPPTSIANTGSSRGALAATGGESLAGFGLAGAALLAAGGLFLVLRTRTRQTS